MYRKEPISLEDGWKRMKEGIDRLISILETENDSVQFTAEEYMILYTTTYNMCTQKAPNEFSADLYQRYQNEFKTYLGGPVHQRLKDQGKGLPLLKELSRAWSNQEVMVRWLTKFFNYLDRYYVLRHNLPNLEQVALTEFSENILKHFCDDARDGILELMAKERENEPIDQGIVKNVLNIFLTVQLDQGTDTYKERFQRYFLENLKEYYTVKARHWIQDDSCPEYLVKAENCLQDEEARCQRYLHPDSKQPVLETAQDCLLKAVQQELIEKDTGFSALLDGNKTEDLKRMSRLFTRCGAAAILPIAEIFKKHVEEEGLQLLRQVNAVAKGDGKTEVNKKDLANAEQDFIRKVLELQDKYLEVVKNCFDSNSSMHKALKDAFEAFCNKPVADTSSAELVANFCDALLRKGGNDRLSDEDIDKMLEKVVKLLVYINDRDMFSEFHRKKLARRLLGGGAVDTQEQGFLQRLKAQCGAHFTQKMEGMCNDLQVARQKQQDFEKWLEENPSEKPSTDLDVKVLTTGFWPTYKQGDLSLNQTMESCVTAFQKFYDSTTKHRKLSWIHSLGNMLMKARFRPKPKELQLAPFQGACLMLFNDAEELSYEEILQRLNLPDEDLGRTLTSLACAKHHILVRQGDTPADKKKPKKLAKEDVFRVNWDFTDKMFRIKVPMLPVEDKRKVVEDVQKDRKYAIDAAIVRIMKSRRILEHSQLVLEVMQQVQRTFSADQKTIKKRLEDLIAREYLVRDSANSNLYKYVA